MNNDLITLEWTILFEILYELDLIKNNLYSFNLLHISDKNIEDSESEIDCMKYFLSRYRNNPILKYKCITKNNKLTNMFETQEQFTQSQEDNSQSFIINTTTNPDSSKDVFSNLAKILYVLPENGDMIYKMSLPLEKSSLLNLIYLSYQYFETLTIYKPIQSAYNKEFYLVGKGFKQIPDGVMFELFNIVEHYDKLDGDTIDLFDDTYPEAFVNQMTYINKMLVDKHTYIINKQLYYFDNYKYLDRKFKKLVPKFIKEKNIEWLKRYKLRK